MKRIKKGPFLVRWTCDNCGHHVPYAFGYGHCTECGVGEYRLPTTRRIVTIKFAWWRRAIRFWQVARR